MYDKDYNPKPKPLSRDKHVLVHLIFTIHCQEERPEEPNYTIEQVCVVVQVMAVACDCVFVRVYPVNHGGARTCIQLGAACDLDGLQLTQDPVGFFEHFEGSQRTVYLLDPEYLPKQLVGLVMVHGARKGLNQAV